MTHVAATTTTAPGSDERLAARYLDEDLLLSDTHAWTFVRLPLAPYEYLAGEDRTAIAERIFLALGALVTGSDSVETRLWLTPRPIPINYWAEDLDERVQGWSPTPGWQQYQQEMTEHVKDEEYLRKEVYLGVCLGSRAGKRAPQMTVVDTFLGPIRRLISSAEGALAIEDDVVSAAELDHWRPKAREVHRSLRASSLRATKAHPNAIAWLITKPLHPEMVCPPPTVSPNPVWGPGQIEALGEGLVTNGHKYLTIEQEDPRTGKTVTGYSATLALSRFPDALLFPDQEPWMHHAAALGFPVDITTSMTLVPALKVQKDVGRKLMDAKDQATHIAETGASVPLDIQEQYNRATALQYLINKDRMPWAYGRHRITVTASTPEVLRARVRAVIEHYRELSIDVVWPTGDQLDLLRERQPGGKVGATAYLQRQELLLIGGGMPTASAEVGDRIDEEGKGWVGPYIGRTTSRIRTMVCFSPHVAMARNFPPCFAIIGAPGGGKSFFAFTVAYQAASQGVWTIYLDPKADAAPMVDLPGLGKPRLIDLRSGNDGLLDPFSLADTIPEAVLLALETVRLLLGGKISEEREQALMAAIQVVASESSPSLSKVVDLLLADPSKPAAHNLGTVLGLIRDLPFARLAFAANTGQRIRPEEGLTVITLLGLELPASAQVKQEEYSYENRLAVSVMYLLTRYARRLMLSMDKSHPKMIVIDEAWAITKTPQGQALIPQVARMGRSHNTALGLVSQNADDLGEEQITNSISTFFAFRSTNSGEIRSVLNLIQVEQTRGHADTVRELNNGECLMRDLDGRLARVQVDSWNRTLFHAFDTNPLTRGKAERHAALAAAA